MWLKRIKKQQKRDTATKKETQMDTYTWTTVSNAKVEGNKDKQRNYTEKNNIVT